MWSKNGTPVPTSTTPMPSRSSSTMICVSWVSRSTRATRFIELSTSSRAARNAAISSGVPDA